MNSSLILNQSGFVLANARVLAAASQAAYQSGAAGPRQLAPQAPECTRLGRSNVAIPANAGWYPSPTGMLSSVCALATHANTISLQDPTTNTHATLTTYDDCTVIAFRGTASLRDWLTDAEFPLRPLPGSPGRVHAGFLTAIDSILPDLLAFLAPPKAQSPEPKASPVFLTGHSLGGALAVLAAWYLQAQGLPVHSVYTFGQPRVGDRAFASLYSALLGTKTYRTVNQNDLVPRVPGVLLGYSHAGELAFINTVGSLVLNPSWFSRLISDALGLYHAYRRLDDGLITDHFVAGYVAALNQIKIQSGKRESQQAETKTTNPTSTNPVSRLPLSRFPL